MQRAGWMLIWVGVGIIGLLNVVCVVLGLLFSETEPPEAELDGPAVVASAVSEPTPRADGQRQLLQNSRPNILLIITDDQRYDTMDFMPRTKARIFDAGVTFSHAYVTTPLCCPSRASILTGLYARHHGVHTNADPRIRLLDPWHRLYRPQHQC
jgi:hypothetical protein